MVNIFLQDQICQMSFTIFLISIIRLYMKADPINQHHHTPKQLRPLNPYRHRSLQKREDIYRLMRAMQSQERGALDEAIKILPIISKGQHFFFRGKRSSFKKSLADSKQLSRCIIHTENERAIEDCLAQRQAEKSLIIKNSSVRSSKSKYKLNKTPLKHSPSQYSPHQKLKSIEEGLQIQLKSRVNRVEGRKHMLGLERIKTQGDANIKLDNRKHPKKPLCLIPKQYNLQALDRIKISLNKSLPLNDLQSGKEDRTDNSLTPINRLGNQSDYLTIKRLKQQNNCKYLHQTNNAKVEKTRLQELDLPAFRKYSQISQLL